MARRSWASADRRSGNLESCVVTQLYRLALGRRETAGDMSDAVER